MALVNMVTLFLIVVLLISFCRSQYFSQPEQIHISYTGDPTEMMVTWVTQSLVNNSIVVYGEKSWTMQVRGYVKAFKDGGVEARIIYIHRAKLINLIPGKHYQYYCGSSEGWSGKYFFKAMQSGSDWSPRFAVFGDMGNENAVSLGRLQLETQKGFYDAFLHVGDFAYDMFENNGRVGDEFMRQIETIAAYVPYMTCVGNHEQTYNFSHYRERFTMPGDTEGLWYSYNIGPAHIIAFTTEIYYFLQYGWELIPKQYAWMEKDLKIANLPENRAKHPWIITMAHKPMYCTNNDDPDMCNIENQIRVGLPYIHKYGFEDMFYKYGVDLTFWAHEHSYERLWPVYDNRVYNGSYFEPYTNPKAPVHIITGSAGCWSKHDPFRDPVAPWTAFRNSDYGYTRMLIANATHIFLEQVSDDQGGAVIDKITLIKEKHGFHAWK